MAARIGWGRPAHDQDREFSEYYLARGASMRATAYLLSGDWHLAEDLTQTAFTKLYLVWKRVARHDALDAYLRRTIFRAFLDHKRRPWRRESVSETTGSLLQQVPARTVSNDDRLVLISALKQVPARQRAVLVLRFWEDLSVEETAKVLGCAVGTVKSQSTRGLQTLRELLGESTVSGTTTLETTR